MRPFVLASLLFSAVVAAPGVHARVEIVTDAAHHAWTEQVGSFSESLSDHGGMAGSFAPGDDGGKRDRAAIERGTVNTVDIAMVSPIRRDMIARARRDKVATLPEPATWIMLLLGFGAMGGALRWKLRRSEERFNAKIRRIEAGETA